MATQLQKKQERRMRRRKRTRKKIFGTPGRPRLSVYRSVKHMHVQIINDLSGHTLVSASTTESDLEGDLDYTGNCEAAARLGEELARRALEEGIEKIVLDTGPFQYHGRVEAFADAAREEGLNF